MVASVAIMLIGDALNSHELYSIVYIAEHEVLVGRCSHESRVSIDGQCILY